MLRYLNMLRKAVWRAFGHGAFATAKAAAYSSILTLFPAFLVVATIIAMTSSRDTLLREITYAIGIVMPPGSRAAALGYLQPSNHRPLKEIISASLILFFAASGVMISWMEGFRRAYGISDYSWGFWRERFRSFFLVFLSFVPMTFALGLIAFGSVIENWLALRLGRDVGYYLILLFVLARWLIAGFTSVTVIMLIYHWSLPRVQPWHKVLPGAILATLLWFPFTLAFGRYVTRYATYNLFYGPLGAAIALLVWLYSISIIILIGAEFNALANPRESVPRRRRTDRQQG